MSPQPTRGSPSLRFKLTASLVVLALCLGGLELFARTIGPEAPSMRGNGGWVLMGEHATRLWGLPPGVTQSRPFEATINAEGYRGEVAVMPRPEGVKRLILVGDSTFFGHGVDDDETLSVAIASTLGSRNIVAEVVNFGVPGYSTEQTRLQLDEQGWALEPDVVLMGNLWSDNDFASYADADLFRTREAFLESWWGRSSLLRLLAASTDRMRGGSGARIITWMDSSDWPEDGVRRVPLQRYAQNLDGMIRAATAHGAAPVLIAPCNNMLLMNNAEGTPWMPYFDAQAQLAAHHGIPLVESCAPMLSSGFDIEDLLVDSMHFSATGNRLVGIATARTLIKLGWPIRALPEANPEPFDVSGLEDHRPRDEITELTRTRGPQRLLFGDADAANKSVTSDSPGGKSGNKSGGGGGGPPNDAQQGGH